KLESGLESLSALYLHLEKLGSTRCVGHCITTREGRLLSVSESLLTNLRLNRERVYERSFGDYFFFQPAFYEQQVGSSAAVISWKQLHYTTCTFQPDDGPSVRLAACSLQVPYPGELEAWNICLMREGDDVSAITGAENAPTILIAEDHP